MKWKFIILEIAKYYVNSFIDTYKFKYFERFILFQIELWLKTYQWLQDGQGNALKQHLPENSH